MKKIICFLLAVCLAFALFVPCTAFAANGPAFSVSSASVKAGKTAEIKISIKNNPGICSAKLAVEFDSDLTLNAVTYGSAFSKAQAPEKLTSPVVLNWFAGLSDSKANGEFATLTFSVSKTAANGKHAIKITYDANDVVNVNEDNIKFAVENGTVTVSDGAGAASSASGETASADVSAEETENTDTATYTESVDEKTGDPLLGEILFDEDGNEIDSATTKESVETVGALPENSSHNPAVLIAIILASVLLAGGATFFVLRKRSQRKGETQE